MTIPSKTERPFAPEHHIPRDCLTWSIYQTNLQDLTRQQRQSPPVGHIDDDDLPF
ncbi:hypothetical protein [Bradyrhizobium sp.]|uniref:hypothetical protein n=1 Tax=Bradyrhizobium sp. TaxID=376 RepID=UPI003D099EAC